MKVPDCCPGKGANRRQKPIHSRQASCFPLGAIEEPGKMRAMVQGCMLGCYFGVVREDVCGLWVGTVGSAIAGLICPFQTVV
jgi:hypothetical protein